MLARLVGRGLLTEAADPADRRRTRVGASAAGQAAFGPAAFGPAAAGFQTAAAALAPLLDEELEHLAQRLDALMRHHYALPEKGG